MALNLCITPSLACFPLLTPNPRPHSSSASFLYSNLHPPLQSSSRSLTSLTPSAIPSTTSQNPIFLPFLEEHEIKEEEKQRKEEEEELNSSDPIVKFFKSRASSETRDPEREGKYLFKRNTHVSRWRLADIKSMKNDEYKQEAEQLDSGVVDSNPVQEQEEEEGVLEEILQLARNVPENSTLGEQLGSTYVGKIGISTCVEILSSMGNEGLFMSCLYFFEWMGSQEPSLVSPKAYSIMFTILGVAGMGENLMILYTNLPFGNQFKDVCVYNSAISGLSYCGRYDDAWKVYEEMEEKNIQPDHVTCCILITVMRKSGRGAKDAWELFERMNNQGVKWSLEVFGTLIKSFCDEGLRKEALIIQSDMEKNGISSTTFIYNTLMDAYTKDNHVEEAEGLFKEMKEKGIKPNCVSYNILMYAYSRRFQPEIVEDLLLEMRDVGLEPNVKSYTCLISAYGRQKNMSEKAANAFLRMKKLGIKPTCHSYTCLIHSYSVDGWHEKAYAAFENMKREEIKPSIQTYTALIDAFRRSGDTETLIKIWKMMRIDKIQGTRVTFNTLLDGFAKQGCYIEARDVISEFGKIGHQPTALTYNMLMNAYARGGQHSRMPQLLKEMTALNLKPDSVTYSTMIYAYVRVRDFSRAFYYHKQMVKSKQLPDPKSYKKLREILEVKAAVKNRKDKRAILGIVSSKMGLPKPRKGKKDEFWKYRRG